MSGMRFKFDILPPTADLDAVMNVPTAISVDGSVCLFLFVLFFFFEKINQKNVKYRPTALNATDTSSPETVTYSPVVVACHRQLLPSLPFSPIQEPIFEQIGYPKVGPILNLNLCFG